MRIAYNLKHAFPAGTRAALKKRYPYLIERVAIGLDTIPIVLDVRWWLLRLRSRFWLNPRPRRHAIATRMWSGFGDQTVKELEQLKCWMPGRPRIRTSAAWSLAQWYAAKGDYGRSLDNLLLMLMAAPKLRRSAYTQLMVVECLLQLDRPEDARRWLDRASRGGKHVRTEFHLSAANIVHALAKRPDSDTGAYLQFSPESERLRLLNKAYEEAGFSKVERRDETRPLSIDNLTVRGPRPVETPAKLSILMPAYNCADTLPIALTSILEQSWKNLEVIIVDDKSQDETWSVIQKFACLDCRIIPVRHDRNGGAYAARNTALHHATGDFVTVHDADDWSHPEKVAAQMLYALSQPDGISTTVGVRVSHDLVFKVNAAHAGMLMQNMSSLLLKRHMLVDLGGWDMTRVAADSELYERVKAKHNLETNKLFATAPLTLILFSDSSLTQTKAAGLATVNYGARRQYKEAYRFWHDTELAKLNPDLRVSIDRRFPAPDIMLGRKDIISSIDILIIGDFARVELPYDQEIARWQSLASAGFKLGLVHWPSYESAGVDIALPVRSVIAAGLIQNIVSGEMVSCKAAIVLDEKLFDIPPDPLPGITAEHLFVVTRAGLSPQQEEWTQRHFSSTPLPITADYLAVLQTRLGHGTSRLISPGAEREATSLPTEGSVDVRTEAAR